jgi:hypothetical protein
MFFRLILSYFCICILALMSVRSLALASTPPLSPFAHIINSPNDFSAHDVTVCCGGEINFYESFSCYSDETNCRG